MGMAPLTGVPLPFISYGSSNMVVLLGAMGLLLNVAGNPHASSGLRVVEGGKGRREPKRTTSRDSGRRDSGARRARAGGRRRAAG
jgi:cell division protein FtsW